MSDQTASKFAPDSPWRDKEGIAARYGRSTRCITNWQRKRVIPYVKQGRNLLFDVRKCDKALEKYEIKSVACFDRSTNSSLKLGLDIASKRCKCVP
jgi:hypothetical protein